MRAQRGDVLASASVAAAIFFWKVLSLVSSAHTSHPAVQPTLNPKASAMTPWPGFMSSNVGVYVHKRLQRIFPYSLATPYGR